MGLNLDAQTEVPTGELGPEGTKVVPAAPAPPPLVGDIAGHFPQLEIIECLGRGGMGVVYKARQPKLDRFVALKILAREKERDTHFAERFQREARALARLNHPNIVAVHDFGETGGLFYLLMEFVDGVNLRQMIRADKMTPEQALRVVPPICEALQYAHQQGIVHRDIKPENILVDKQGRVKIADFGIAKMLGAEGRAEPLTGDQQAVGTPHYMAPEQLEKPQTVDHRADIYSLGVVFYEMLTGELPLGKFAPPSQKVHIDVRLDEVVLHALEKEPARRYQQVGEVKTDLDTIAGTARPGARGGARRGWTPPPRMAPSGGESAWQQVKGPAIGLMITGVLNLLAIPVIFLLAVAALRSNAQPSTFLLLAVPLAALVVGGTLLVAGLLMKRLTAYWLAVAASLLAILTPPTNLIGLPIGIWALVVLSHREVREAFGKGYGPPLTQPAPPGSGGWKVAVVIVAALLLVIAIPVAAILLAIGLPAISKSRAHVSPVNAPIRQPGATFLVQGTVTDATTGQPLAGARVDDNLYGARAGRTPQQAWTDAQGHYDLFTWEEEHTLAASAPGYQTKLSLGPQAQMDFQLQPAENAGTNVSSPAAVPGYSALEETNPPAPPGYELEQSVKPLNPLPSALNAGTNVSTSSVAAMPSSLGESNRPAPELAGSSANEMEQRVKRGSEAWKRGDYSEALGLLMPAALHGEPVAQYRIGIMYALGQGVTQDSAQATRWFRSAAARGDRDAQYSLGLRYVLGDGVGKDFAEAARWFRMAAEQGQPDAQFSLGMRYLEGEGVSRDYEAAARWFKLAADQGRGMAASALAECFAKGRGVPQDLVEAYKWLTLAHGHIEPSRVSITLQGLEKKLTPGQLAEAQRRAEEFVPKPTAPGTALSQVRGLDSTVQRGHDAWRRGDYPSAFKLLLPAAVQGNAIAQHRLGVMYINGDGVPRDYAEATRWFRLAADQNQGEAQFSMGLRYFEGQSVPRDLTEAARWFQLAANQGVGVASSMLAQCYATGRGVPQDYFEAYKWLSVAGTDIEPQRATITLRELRRKLTADQLAEAERRAREFVPKRTGPAYP